MADYPERDFPRDPVEFRRAGIAQALTGLFDSALQDTQKYIAYYAWRGAAFSRHARALRTASLVLFMGGTSAPLFGLLASRLASRPAAGANLTALNNVPFTEIGYLFLAFAGGAVLYDQLFGMSRSWMRFRQSEAKLRGMSDQLRYGWAAALADTDGDLAPPPVRKRLTDLLVAHNLAVGSLIEAETKEWADQFRAQIEGFDQKVQAAQIDALSRAQASRDAVERASGPADTLRTPVQADGAPGFEGHAWAEGDDPEEGVL